MTTTTALDTKIREVFGEYAVDKGLIRRLGFSGDDRHVPSYVMDWIVTLKSKSSDSTASLERSVQEFIAAYLPAKGDKERVKFKLSQGEVLTILDAISVRVKLGREVQYLATIPCLDEKSATIDESLIAQHEELLQGSTWGAVRLTYDSSTDIGSGIRIMDFKPMQTGRVSLEAFCECREKFSVEEWIDVIVRTLGYEAGEYSEQEKVWMLCRLIPVVQNRVNMMELAPPGSGKSYVYNNVSRHVWLTAAEISPAVLFYNRHSKTPGILTRYDLLVLDEAQSVRFTKPAEIQAQLKGYLEQGVFTRGDCCATAECGLMLLANIELRQDPHRRYSTGLPAFLPARPDYVRKLPDVFLESALLDRFHGILPGWEIPPFSTEQQANGPGLKADFFAEICHTMRTASHLSRRVRARMRLSGGKRDCTAIERLACGMAKVLLIDPAHPRFDDLVVETVTELRRLVRTQLNAIDPQGYSVHLQISRLDASGRATPRHGRISHYDLLEEIGKGGMAVVFKGLDRDTEAIVAVKRVRTDGGTTDEAAIRREIDIYRRLQEIDSLHVLGVRDIFQEGETYALVTEYADGGSLWDLMGGDIPDEERTPLDEETTRNLVLAVLDGLSDLHENDIVHRDIKPQNILRCDDDWKIADFGISKLLHDPVTGYTFQGAHTAPWAPPEQMEGAPAHPSADIYAIARVIGFLLTGSKKKDDLLALQDHWTKILVPCIAEIASERPDVGTLRAQISDLSL